MAMRRTTLWKLLGLAGAAGVIATGALVARDERQRRAYTPDEVRDQLRRRHEAAVETPRTPPSEGQRERM